MIINTHSHIYDNAFEADREEVFQRALEAGVEMMLLPNTDETTLSPMMEFYDKHPDNVRVMLGLHPEEVREDHIDKLKVIEKQIENFSISLRCGRDDRLVGIGEIGLDYYWDDTYRTEQVEVFCEQLHWAKDLGLPVSIHTRNAFKEMFKVLDHEQDGRLAGVMHCFNGTYDEAKTALSYGFHLGLGGVITYKNCGVKEFLPDIPMDRIVFETDDPYLPPVPYRGKRNEPAYIVKTAEKVAEIYGVTTEDICKITTNNAKSLFRLRQDFPDKLRMTNE